MTPIQPRSRSSSAVLVAVAVLALIVVAGLNALIGRMASGEHQDEAAATESSAASSSGGASGSAGRPTPPASSAYALSSLPPDATVGPANANTRIVVGWSWTPDVQADPNALADALQAARQMSEQGAQVRIVNTDAVPGAPRGVFVNKKKVFDFPAYGTVRRDQIMYAISSGASGR